MAKEQQPSGKRPRKVTVLDRHISARIKLAREMAGLTQPQLGACIGVSGQQIQKYESAQSRVPASRLHPIGEATNTSAAFFYEGFNGSELKQNTTDIADAKPSRTSAGALTQHEALQSFERISPRLRHSLVELLRVLDPKARSNPEPD